MTKENEADPVAVSGNVATPEPVAEVQTKAVVDGFYRVKAGSREQIVAADTAEQAKELFRGIYDIVPTDCVPYEGALLPGLTVLYERDKLRLAGDVTQTKQYKAWKGGKAV